jgi:hypothetical protein
MAESQQCNAALGRMQTLLATLATTSYFHFHRLTDFIAMPPNLALNRTGRHTASTWRASARHAG